MSILEHPAWAQLAPLFRSEAYDRDTNAARDVRHRIEVATPPDAAQRRWLLGTQTPCVACGRVCHPIRERRGWRTLYFAAGCPPTVNPRCSRTMAARDEYRRVIAALDGRDDATSPRLF